MNGDDTDPLVTRVPGRSKGSVRLNVGPIIASAPWESLPKADGIRQRTLILAKWVRRLIHILAFLPLSWGLAFAQGSRNPEAQEWRFYGHDPGGMRFSPLQQINTSNVDKLQRAWTYRVAWGWDSGIIGLETTPLMIDGVLYFTTQTSRAIALDAETGKELWVFDPFAHAVGENRPRYTIANRGAAYWEGPSSVNCLGEAHKPDKRIFYGTLDGRLFALDAATGQAVPGLRQCRGRQPARGCRGQLSAGSLCG